MHNIKDIRQNPNFFKDELSKRFVDIDLKKILSLDEKNRRKKCTALRKLEKTLMSLKNS